MGNLTPKPIKHVRKMKLTSKFEKYDRDTTEKVDVSATKNMYKNPKIRNSAPNCVQKNIR